MNESPNPYQAPGQIGDRQIGKRRSPIRYVVAAIMGLLGLAGFAPGVLVVIIWYKFEFVENVTTNLLEVIAACLLYLSLGTCWLLSAVLTWRARYRRALTFGIVGLAILVAIFAVAGL